MSQISFKIFFLENILNFLWRQWSNVGIAGGSKVEDLWTIDPEALLVFSQEFARYEPRLYDEILDWLVINGKFIDVQRLRGILRKQDEVTRQLVSAVAYFLTHEASTYKRKWEPLSLLKKADENTQHEMLFKKKDGQPYPEPKTESIIFHKYGFLREDFTLRHMSRPISVSTRSNIRFLLRALFGLGSRAECILYLLTHEAGHPSEVANSIGISVRGTQDALIELSESGFVLTRIKGKRKIEYWLSQKKWWEFLSGMNYSELKTPVWVDWIALFSALRSVWDVLNEVEKTKSDYMRSSKLRQAMEKINLEFSKSGLDLPLVPSKDVMPDHYEQEFQSFISKVLGARSEAGK